MLLVRFIFNTTGVQLQYNLAATASYDTLVSIVLSGVIVSIIRQVSNCSTTWLTRPPMIPW